MKILYTIIFCCITFCTASAQTSKEDLLAKAKQQYLEQMKAASAQYGVAIDSATIKRGLEAIEKSFGVTATTSSAMGTGASSNNTLQAGTKKVLIDNLLPSDSIALTSVNQLGVYYTDNGKVKKIEPITYAGIKVSGFIAMKGKMEYDGENSDNKVKDQCFYVFIPTMMQSSYSFKNFKIVELTAKKGKRQLTTVKIAPFYGKTGADGSGMKSEHITDELVRITPATKMKAGHYGIFYDYAGGTPTKLYDFDIE